MVYDKDKYTPEMLDKLLRAERTNTIIKTAAVVTCFYIFFGMPKNRPTHRPS
jgi:hypothetical protein